MGADVDEILDGQVLDPGRRQAAEERAARIRSGLAGLVSTAQEYAQAILEEDWKALGCDSARQWREEQFGALQPGAEARRQVHELLSGEGMSTRDISAATGTPQRTVQRDIGEPRQSGATPSDQPGRNAAVTRPEPPKTGAQRAREHRDRKREEPCDHRAGLELVCKGCGQKDKVFGGDIDKIEEDRERWRQRAGELEEKLAAPQPEFRRCGYAAPGNAVCEIAMPDGRTARGWLCRPHQALLSGAPAFGEARLLLVPERGGETGPCGWRVPAEEAMEETE